MLRPSSALPRFALWKLFCNSVRSEPAGSKQRRAALRVEPLEERCTPAVWTVNTLVDENNGVGAGGVSLREAIAAAAASGDTIEFAAGLQGGTITLDYGELLITKSLTIDGPGANRLAVSRDVNAWQHRIFEIATDVSVTLRGLGIRNGNWSFGGGVANFGTVTLEGLVLSGNSADYGAGFYNAGTATVVGCTFTGNHGRNPAAGEGAGMFHQSGKATISNSTFSGNQAALGGGLYVSSGIEEMTVIHSTITDNTAADIGGGVYYFWGWSDKLHLGNSIVAGNHSPSNESAADISGRVISDGHNLIGDGRSAFLTPQTGDQIGHVTTPGTIDPRLAALIDNGGPTPTRALLAGSPAIDAGEQPFNVLAFDQRGAGFNRVINNRLDIGAFEYQPPKTDTVLLPPLGATAGQEVVFKAVVNGSPGANDRTGVVRFYLNALLQDTVPVSGNQATFRTTLPAGNYVFTASYGGDGVFSPSDSDPVTLIVHPAPVMLPTPSAAPLTAPTPGVFTQVVRLRGRTEVRIVDTVTGQVRMRRAFRDRVRLLRRDLNGDAVLDSLVLVGTGRRLRRLAFSGTDGAVLPAPARV